MARFITQLRHGTTSDWETSTVVPAKNELVVEYCNDGRRRFKLGDGNNLFTELSYIDDEVASKLESLQHQVSILGTPKYDEGDVVSEAVAEEVANIRVSTYHGEYDSAGDAVRAVEEELYDLKGGLRQLINAEAVNGLEYINNELWLTANGSKVGNSVTIQGGTGEGPVVSGYSVALTNRTGSLRFNAASSSKTFIEVSFEELLGTESTEVPGYLTVKSKLWGTSDPWQVHESYNDVAIQQHSIKSIDVTSILQLDKQVEIQVTVTGATSGKTASLSYLIKCVDAYISTSFSPLEEDRTLFVANDNFTFSYKCFGLDIEKHVYIRIDDEPYWDSNIGRIHNQQKDQVIDVSNLSHGGHSISVYFETPEGARSNVETRMFFYDTGSSSDTMLSAIPVSTTIKNGEILQIYYSAVTPIRELTPELEVTVYTVENFGEHKVYEHRMWTDVDKLPHLYETVNYPSSGDVYVEFRSGSTVKTMILEIEENQQGQTLKFEESGLIYAFNTSGMTNNDASRSEYVYTYQYSGGAKSTNIQTVLTDFNWVSNGYNVDNSDCLRLSGDARCCIKMPVLTSMYTTVDNQEVYIDEGQDASISNNGRTVEFDIKLTNVRNYNTPVVRCMSILEQGPGFVITPQYCYMLDGGTKLETDTSGFILNEEQVTAAYLKDDTRLRISFVIEPRGSVGSSDGSISSQCLTIYVNGQFASSHPYDGSFTNTSEFITLGSNDCTLDIFDIRFYNRGLSSREILKNYIAAPKLISDKISRFNENDVVDNNSCVVYDLAKEKYTCLLVTGELSMEKDSAGQREREKKESGLILTRPGCDTPEFSLMDKDENGVWLSMNNVQGTTSVTYPVKNYKFYLRKLNGYDSDTHKAVSSKVKYKLKGEGKSIGESTLCWKCDFMSTDHANTFNANLADTLFSGKDLIAKKENPLVQNTVYGFPCLLFQRDDENSTIKFVGAGTLNNDKGNSATFGLDCDGDEGNNTTRQKWEFKNSTSPVCLFQTDRLLERTSISGLNPYAVYGNLESCYPDEGDLKDENLLPNYSPIQTLYTWVCQRANFLDASSEDRERKKKIFREEFSKHFSLEHALVYYLFMEFTALVDNRAKNMFLRCENIKSENLVFTDSSVKSLMDTINSSTGEVDFEKIDWEKSTFAIWLTDLYDLDSCFGVENVGNLHVPYHAEWDYTRGDKRIFNGYESKLWLMFEEAFEQEIKEKAQELTKQKLTYTTLCNYHGLDSASDVEKHCPAVVNADMKYKYEDPWTSNTQVKENPDDTTTVSVGPKYKYLQRGDRKLQKSLFLLRRYNMLCSKYQCDSFVATSNSINFRSSLALENNSLELTYCQSVYPVVRQGDTGDKFVTSEKTFENNSQVFSVSIGANEKIYICGGSTVSNIGDISVYKPYDMNFGKAVNLRTLKLGSEDDGYVNENMTPPELASCKLLEELNVAGWTELSTLDLSNNYLLEKVIATRCNANIKFPEGGVLTNVKLGAPPELKILNHSKLTSEGFSCEYNNLRRLWIENTPIDSIRILSSQYEQLTQGIRLVGVSGEVDNNFLVNILLNGIKGKYISQEGQLTSDKNKYPYISGELTCTDSEISADLYNQLKAAYPDLVIKYKQMSADVTFKLPDGTEVTQTVTSFNGVAGYAEIQVSKTSITIPHKDGSGNTTTISIPTMESTAEFDYTWDGWTTDINSYESEPDALLNIDSDRIVYPAFTANTRSYTVNFYNGSTLLKTCQTLYGTSAQPPEDPYKEGYDNDEVFKFQAWYPDPGRIEGDLDCYAQYYVVDGKYYPIKALDIGYEILDETTKTIAITSYNTNDETVIQIPETPAGLEGHTVTEIDGFEGKDVEIVMFPETVTRFRNRAFNECSSLEEVEIGENVSTLEDGCFSNCTGLKNIKYDAISAEVDDPTDTTPSPFNYSYSSQGANLSIGNTVTKIPRRLFYQTDNLSQMNKRVLDTITWETDSVCTAVEEYSFYKANPRVINFPESLTFIGANAFVGNNSITKLRLPENLETIQSSAFASWSKLKTVEILASVDVIDDSVFADCGSLEEISVAEANTRFYSVDGCLISTSGSKLLRATNKAVVPKGIAEISPNAFSGLSSISEIKVPGGITKIPSNMASNCASLTTVDLPDSITDINTQAFMNSSNLCTINIPEGVTDIYSNAFANTAIEELTIPSSIKDFHSGYTFRDCTKLRTVTFSGIDNITNYGEKMFRGCTALSEIYWPGTQEDAENMDLWNYMEVDTDEVSIYYGYKPEV